MNTIRINASKSYDVLVQNGCFKDAGRFIKNIFPEGKIAIVTDDTVQSLYADELVENLKSCGFDDVFVFSFPHGEKSKNYQTLIDITEFLAEKNLTRTDLLIALGGGVVGDITGFAAAIYLRGIKFVQIPTTFLAAIDSSVGGKTAVNLNAGKNLIGSFYQPELVICDPKMIDTLDDVYFDDGVAEAIKYGAIMDSKLFELFEKSDMRQNLEKIIVRCIELKNIVVTEDEFDVGLRQLLNFGHTIGHSIEKCSNFKITHGHAVAIGMAIIARGCVKLGITPENDAKRLISLIEKYNLPTKCEFDTESLYAPAVSDKKRTGGDITVIVMEKVGGCVLHKIPVEGLKELIENGR
ncbi:MAG: 3-dehydroquinate synthase [Clostridia bacterium]|nr:3-dehydroquinate synthase [Clostridia bacterium]